MRVLLGSRSSLGSHPGFSLWFHWQINSSSDPPGLFFTPILILLLASVLFEVLALVLVLLPRSCLGVPIVVIVLVGI